MCNKPDTGFAIRCPHCGSWYINEEDDLRVLALKDADELNVIMGEFKKEQTKGESYTFKHRKMFRCNQPRWSCPASYEVFIFKEEQTALNSLQEIREKWDISRDFRLFKSDKINRWDKHGENKYYCIMFGTEPVPRLQHIELEHLLNVEIASNLITAICEKAHAPITVYSANVIVFSGNRELYWMPIEDYHDEEASIPSRYNVYCSTCRRIATKTLRREFLEEFEANRKQGPESAGSEYSLSGEKPPDDNDTLRIVSIEPEDCYFVNPKTNERYWDNSTGKCAGREPVCGFANQQDPLGFEDLNHCPAFIDKRRKMCPCYKADMKLIKEVSKKFKGGSCDVVCPNPSFCPAAFLETGIAIKVHEHLVGVAMLGQMYSKEEDVNKVDKFMSNVNTLTPGSPLLGGPIWNKNKVNDQLVRAREVLLWSEDQIDDPTEQLKIRQKDLHVRFKVDAREISKRSEYLKTIVSKIENIAESRYKDIRSRSEHAFRNEIMGYIQHTTMRKIEDRQTSFFKGPDSPITHILNRMREFWAFKALVYGWLNFDDNSLRAIACSTLVDGNKQSEGFGYPGIRISSNIQGFENIQNHPITWLYDPSKKAGPPRNGVVEQIFGEYMKTAGPFFGNYNIPIQDTIMQFVIAPFENNIYLLVFLSRDESGLSETYSRKSQPVSEICQEYMLRTCTEAVYELCDVRFREDQINAKENITSRIIANSGPQSSNVKKQTRKGGERKPFQ